MKKAMTSDRAPIQFLIKILLSVPVSLIIWLIAILINRFSNGNNNEYTLSPLRSFLSTFFPFVFMVYGYKKKSVNTSGAIFGIIVGLLLTIASPVFLVVLGAFFFSSSKATKYKQDYKKNFEKDFKDGGQRNWIQVLCNGGVGGFLAICYLLEVGVGDQLPIDFQNHYYASILGISIMSSFACVNGDTWASELGILSKTEPFLITTLSRVPKGTNGGVSLWGLFVSFLGGLFIGIFYYMATLIFVDDDRLINSPPQFPIIFLGGVAGLFGSILDSFLGATCQFSGQTLEGYIVEDIEDKVIKISGRKILNNHSVNFLSCLITALFIPLFSSQFWNLFIATE